MNVPAAERTLQIIELLLSNPDGVTPQELLTALDVSRSSLFLLLNTLKQHGYVEQNEQRGRYRAGPRLQAWRSSNQASFQEVITAFYQETEMLASKETIALASSTRDGILILAQVQSNKRVRSVLETGLSIPADQTAAGQIFSSLLLEEVRKQGYALQVGEETLELALPVCRDGVHPDFVLLLAAPAYRFSRQQVDAELPNLREMAARLSYRMGAAAYAPFHEAVQTETPAAKSLSMQEIENFLKGPWPARLACVRSDGSPHVVPVWQEWDGEKFSILAWHGSQWVDYIRKNPQVSLTVDEPWAPYRRISMRGAAKEALNIDIDTRTTLLSKLSQRYLGQDTPQRFINQVETVFTINPDTLRGWMGLAAEKN